MNKKKSSIILFFVLTLVTLIIIGISYDNFKRYEKMVVSQQKENLMTISKSLSRSLELYTSEKKKALIQLSELISINEEKKFESLKNFYEQQGKEFYSLTYYNISDKKIISYPLNYFQESIKISEIERIIKTSFQYIGDSYPIGKSEFCFNILTPVFEKDILKGVLIGSINMKSLENLLVTPLKLDKYKYAHVKDSNGLILMTPSEQQVGNSVIKSRKEKYPHLYYKDLEDLLTLQMNNMEGAKVYNSYWWPDEELKLIKKINAFSRAHITETFWIVSVVMQYDEIRDPILNYLYTIIFTAVFLIILSSGIVYVIIRMKKKKEYYLMEMNHLKELNRKEAQLSHKRRLETIGTLTGGIAHEFNNILTPILGYSEIALMQLDPENHIYHDVKLICETSKRAKELVEQIMSFSRNKKVDTEKKILCIRSVLESSIKLVKASMPPNIKLLKHIDEQSGNIFANETQIQQIVLNLLGNACHAIEKETGEIRISLTRITKEKENFIRISVEDNGCGINPKDLDEIFKPFFTKRNSGEGTGLGLSMVKDMVEDHRGYIFVQSQVNQGSKFEVLFPSL